jgi:polar amino acid transport system substrate-binding protein
MANDVMPQGNPVDGRGIMADAAMETLKRAGFSGKLEFPPWKRALTETSTGKDQLITGVARTPDRETQFIWLFSVFTMDRAFATTGKQVASYAEAKATFKQIAVPIGSVQYEQLIKEGFSESQFHMHLQDKLNTIPNMLVLGRVDAWFSSVPTMKYILRGTPEAAKIVIGPAIAHTGTEQYVACSKDCSPDLVAKLKTAAEAMKADGTMQTIIDRYQ